LPQNRGGWVFNEKSVIPYLQRELVPQIPIDHRTGKPVGEIDDLDMPYPLLALIIAHVLSKSDEGHVLVFLPGWDEIQSVRNILQDRQRYPLLDLNLNDPDRYELHVLHSTIPIADQQAVFEPPTNPNIRRIVLSTNIAETSVTIPDVVYVVDSAKCKEKRYDPERRLSQLVSAWTGTSNVLQRAGRAGRHRKGEYYGIVSNARFKSMDIHQTVEMVSFLSFFLKIPSLHLLAAIASYGSRFDCDARYWSTTSGIISIRRSVLNDSTSRTSTSPSSSRNPPPRRCHRSQRALDFSRTSPPSTPRRSSDRKTLSPRFILPLFGTDFDVGGNLDESRSVLESSSDEGTGG